MKRKLITIFSLFIVVFSVTAPVYAQTNPQSDSGFFGAIASFFSSIFHGGSQQNSGQNQLQDSSEQNGNWRQGTPSGMMHPFPSGEPNQQTMEEYRLNGLVRSGKITQAQEQAILAEWQKVQAELKAWADSQGINEDYVLGGGLGGGMPQGMMHPGGENGNFQGQNQQGFGGENQGQQGRPGMNGEQGQQNGNGQGFPGAGMIGPHGQSGQSGQQGEGGGPPQGQQQNQQ